MAGLTLSVRIVSSGSEDLDQALSSCGTQTAATQQLETRAAIHLALQTVNLTLRLTIAPPLRQRPDARVGKDDDSQKKASVWMKHKLMTTEKILEAMTRGDYAMLEQNAKGMHVMSYLEGWIRANSPAYKAQLTAFDYANGAVVCAAHEKNLDRVALAYTQLTISCV